MPLAFGKSDLYHKKLSATVEKRIKKIYDNAYKEVSKELSKLDEGINNKSDSYQKSYLKDLQEQLKKAYDNVALDTFSEIKLGMENTSEFVVKENQELLKKFGLDIKGAFSYVPKDVVTSIVNGSIYDTKWSLSSRVWDIKSSTNRDIRKIIGQGIATQASTYEIAKELEKYVNPSAAKEYDWSRLYPGSNKKVDYNAQRLARTTITHAYQQSVKEVTEQNPLSDGILWLATGSKRMCDICAKRDGKVFAPDKLPLDHPNGQCTMATHFSKTPKQISEEMQNELSPKRDELKAKLEALKANAQKKNSGYTNKVMNEQQQKYLTPYGFSSDNMPKDFNDWSHKVSNSQAGEILNDMGTDWGDPHPYQKLEKYYNSKLAPDRMVSGEKLIKQTEKTSLKKSITNEEDLSKFVKEDWMKKIQSQSERHMLDLEKESFNKMTSQQREGLRTYTGSSYREMNGYLRALAEGNSKEEAIRKSLITNRQLKAIDDAMNGLKSSPLKEDLVLRRGTDLGDLAGLLGGNFNENLEMLNSLYNSYGQDAKKIAEELTNRYAGLQGSFAGFTSTSSLYNKGFSGKVEAIIYAPAGTDAASIMEISEFGTSEGETLLNAGTRVELIKVEESDGHKSSKLRMYLRIIGK